MEHGGAKSDKRLAKGDRCAFVYLCQNPRRVRTTVNVTLSSERRFRLKPRIQPVHSKGTRSKRRRGCRKTGASCLAPPHGACLAPAQAPDRALSALGYFAGECVVVGADDLRRQPPPSLALPRPGAGWRRGGGRTVTSRLAPPYSVCLAPAQAPNSTLSAPS